MKHVTRKSSVCWKGGAQGGTQAVTTESGVLKRAKLSLGALLEKDILTSPAELIAAAHASSFSLTLSEELRLGASAPGRIATTATVTMENLAAGWTIKKVHLNVVATLPGVTQGKFIDVTVRAKTTCLISRLLRANISMTAKLEN